MAKGDQTYDGELGKPRKRVMDGEAIRGYYERAGSDELSMWLLVSGDLVLGRAGRIAEGKIWIGYLTLVPPNARACKSIVAQEVGRFRVTPQPGCRFPTRDELIPGGNSHLGGALFMLSLCST